MRRAHHLRPPCDLEDDGSGIWGHVPPVEAHLASPGVYDLDPYDASLFPPGIVAHLIVPGHEHERLDVRPYYRRALSSGLVRVWFRQATPLPAPQEAPGARGLDVDAARHNSYSGKLGGMHSLGAERRGGPKKYPTQT